MMISIDTNTPPSEEESIVETEKEKRNRVIKEKLVRNNQTKILTMMYEEC